MEAAVSEPFPCPDESAITPHARRIASITSTFPRAVFPVNDRHVTAYASPTGMLIPRRLTV
jgi:hypothetical protein